RSAKWQQQAVLFGHAVEAPTEILHAAVQVANLLHPLPAPGRWIKKGHYPERPGYGLSKPTPHGLPVRQFWRSRIIGIEQEVPFRDKRTFPPVADAPVHEKCALVLQAGRQLTILGTEVAGLVSTKALLRFPSSQVGVDQHIAGGDEARATTNHQNQSSRNSSDFVAEILQSQLVKKLGQSQPGQKSENRVVAAQKRGHERVNFVPGQ